MIFKGDEAKGELNGFLDAGSHIQGELHFEDTFRIDGKVTGKIQSAGDLVVGENGEVDGEIHVGRLFVSGSLKGSAEAANRLELTAGCRVTANIKAPSLIIEDGAFFEGRCSMVRPKGEANKPRPAPEDAVAKAPTDKQDGPGGG
ncbi:MAG: polymer-forming cytoskeletal protein [Thermoanaerobaculia bacterium]